MRGFFLGILMWLAVARCVAQTPPPNDYFTNRIALTGPVAVFGGDWTGATYPDSDSEGRLELGPSVGCCRGTLWWSWTAQDSTTVVIERAEKESAEPGGMSVYAGDVYPEFFAHEVVAIDLSHLGQYAVFKPQAGTTYQIQIGAAPSQPMFFRLTVTNAPIVRWQPQTQTVTEGASTIFSAFAIGVKPLHYQWRRGEVDIPGATNMMILFDNITTSDAGGYSVVFTNSTGSVTSRVAQLYVTTNDSPAVLKAVRVVGTNFEFSVSGDEGRRYRVEFSDDLTNWSGPVIMNTNQTTHFKVAAGEAKKFLRVSAYHAVNEVCINHLRQIQTAGWLFAEDNQMHPVTTLTEMDTLRYMIDKVKLPECPLNQDPFAGSYLMSNLMSTLPERPRCVIAPTTHRLEDPVE